MAFLLGMGLVFVLVGFTRIVRSIFGPSAAVEVIVAVVLFAAGSVGPWAARRAAAMLVRLWSRVVRAPRGGRTGPGSDGSDNDPMQEGLAWMLQSVLGVTLGAVLLAGLPATAGAQAAWGWLSTQFFWTSVTEMVALCLLASVAVGVAGLAIGLQLAALHAAAHHGRPTVGYGDRADRRRPAAPWPHVCVTASLLGGVATGLTVVHLAGMPGLLAGQWVLLGAVPMFAISAVSVCLARQAEASACRSPHQADDGCGGTPEWSAAGQPRGLILLSAAGSAGAAAMWYSAWVRGDLSGVGGAGLASDAVHFALMALGAWWSTRGADRREYSVAGCGISLLAAATSMLTVIVLATFRAEGTRSLAMVEGITALAIGYALPYVQMAYVGRSGSERRAWARWTAAVLLGLAAGLAGYERLCAGAGGDVATMAASCLLLLILGGLLFIHDRRGTRQPRLRRIGFAFAVLGVAVMALPTAARHAAAKGASRPLAGSPHAGAAPAPPSQWTALLIEALALAPPGARVAHIGDGDVEIAEDGRVTEHLREGSIVGWPSAEASADRWWRRSHSRYDLIVQTAAEPSTSHTAARLSWEWFAGLRARLLPAAALLVEVPGLDPRAFDSVKRTFRSATDGLRHYRIIVEDAADRRTYLLATPAALLKGNRPLAEGIAASIGPLADAVAETQPPAPLHTLRAPAFALHLRRSTSD